MADFAAVLKKTLDRMGETTPEMREKVYDKARETVKRQIDAMEKAPPQAAIDRQFEKLDSAISALEAEYAPAEDALDLDALLADIEPSEPEAEISEQVDIAPSVEDKPESELETLVKSTQVPDDVIADTIDEIAPDAAQTTVVSEDDATSGLNRIEELKEQALETAAEMEPKAAVDVSMSTTKTDPLESFLNEQISTQEPEFDRASVDSAIDDWTDAGTQISDDVLGPIAGGGETIAATGAQVASSMDDFAAGAMGKMPVPEKKSGFGGILKLLIVVGVLGGAGYWANENRDQISTTWSDKIVPWWQDLTSGGQKASENTTGTDSAVPVRTVKTTTVENNGEAATDAPTAEPAPQDAVTDVSGAEPTVKFTQRLTEDGTEVDDGPSGTNGTETGEGSSVSTQTAGTAAEPAPEDTEVPVVSDPAAPTAQAAEPTQATPVGQRAIFYEERSGSQEGTAIAGATVWSVVNAEPGGDLPVEPAIRAETSIPELGILMEMTIRRNGDKTFPASHIIELFFRVPDTFEGRGIADVQRITFKTNEQDPGNALIAVPAPLDQNIFMIALTDAATAVQTNVNLMSRENWIDIPMQYTSGRRALVTFEKGIPGENVFNEVFAAWDAAPIN